MEMVKSIDFQSCKRARVFHHKEVMGEGESFFETQNTKFGCFYQKHLKLII